MSAAACRTVAAAVKTRRRVPFVAYAISCAAMCLIVQTAAADQVKIRGRNYPSVNILELHNGRLKVVTPAQEVLTPRVSELDFIAVSRGEPDQFSDFNLAEKYLDDGKPGQAIERYGRAALHMSGFWSDLVRARRLMAANRANRLKLAVSSLILVNRDAATGPGVAIRLLPTLADDVRPEDVTRAVQEVSRAIEGEERDERRAVLLLLLFELQRSVPDDRADEAARRVMECSIPLALHTERAFRIKLAAIEHVNRSAVRSATWKHLDRSIGVCPAAQLADFLLLKGRLKMRTAKRRDDWIRASWPFLRVAIHAEDDPRGAEGLHGAALALRDGGMLDKARSLLEECLRHPHVSDKTRTAAQEVLERLGSS